MAAMGAPASPAGASAGVAGGWITPAREIVALCGADALAQALGALLLPPPRALEVRVLVAGWEREEIKLEAHEDTVLELLEEARAEGDCATVALGLGGADLEAEAHALGEAPAAEARHWPSAALHARPGAHSGLASIAVQAAPTGACGRQEAAGAPQPAGARIKEELTAKVNAACGAHLALEVPWQASEAADHCNPGEHRVAARYAGVALAGCPARARSQAAQAGVAVMPSAAAGAR